MKDGLIIADKVSKLPVHIPVYRNVDSEFISALTKSKVERVIQIIHPGHIGK